MQEIKKQINEQTNEKLAHKQKMNIANIKQIWYLCITYFRKKVAMHASRKQDGAVIMAECHGALPTVER